MAVSILVSYRVSRVRVAPRQVGYGANKGIIPITCETLFSRVAEIQKSDSNKEFHVTVSMLEIYKYDCFSCLPV